MTTLKDIQELFEFLPQKDQTIAAKLLEVRDFETLRDLVTSDVTKLNKELDRTDLAQDELEEKSISYASLENLVFCITQYMKQSFYADEDLDYASYDEADEESYLDNLFYMLAHSK